MIWLKILGGLAVVVVGYVVIAGNVVARGHVATVLLVSKRPPAEVWTAITDHSGQAKWRSDLKSLELQPPRDGHVVFRETTAHGTVTYVVDESVANQRYVTRILDENLGYGGRWIFELAPADGGTRLTVTEEGEVKSLMFRALSPFFSKTATIEGYLAALAKRLGDTAAPEIVR